MKRYRVLITCMGGYGALNFLEDIKKSKIGKDIEFYGTHADTYMLARSPLKVNFLTPWAKNEKEYLESINRFVKKYKIDLLIPKSDREVSIVSKYRNLIPCNTFLPENKEIEAAQDKYSFYKKLEGTSVGVAETYNINAFSDIDKTIEKLPKQQKYWIRIKTAGEAGAIGATWVENSRQAKNWIKLWQEMNNTPLNEFTISEFLPGRLFECISFFYKGELIVAKVYENIRYYGASQRISGMSSTPEIAKTCNDNEAKDALDESIKAIETLSKKVKSKPNGIYHMSVKGNYNNKPCVTECNIGRPPSTVAFFNRTGRYNLGELYVRYALDLDKEKPKGVYDLEKKEIYMIRSLDRDIILKTKVEIDRLKSI